MRSAIVLAACLGAGCAGPAQKEPATLTVKGTLTHAERIGLPANSAAIVEVRDTSQPQGRGVAAEQRFDLRGRQVPIPFELELDPAKLEAGKPYAVGGAVTIGGRPAWVSDAVPLTARSGTVDAGALVMKPVRVGAFPTAFQCGDLRATIDFLGERARLTIGQTEYELRQARTADGARYEAVNDASTWFWNRGRGGTLSWKGRPFPECRAVTTTLSDLQGVEWVVEDINGGGIIDRSRATLVFGPDGRLSGRGSCNTYTGRYVVSGDTVRVSDVVSTMRACAPSLMDQEARFHDTLTHVARFEVRADQGLVLHADDRRSILARRGGAA